jgi:hypothetical protein
MFCLALAGRVREARELAGAIQREHPGYRLADFGQAFKLGAELDALVRKAAAAVDA